MGLAVLAGEGLELGAGGVGVGGGGLGQGRDHRRDALLGAVRRRVGVARGDDLAVGGLEVNRPVRRRR